jgi:hypothetical protein
MAFASFVAFSQTVPQRRNLGKKTGPKRPRKNNHGTFYKNACALGFRNIDLENAA